MKTTLQISPKFTMLASEWQDFFRGVFKYFIQSVLFVYCTSTLAKFSIDGFSFDDFTPDLLTLGTIFGGIFSQLISFLSKYVPENIVTTSVPETQTHIPAYNVPTVGTSNPPTVIDTSLIENYES